MMTNFTESRTWEGGSGTGDELDLGPSLGRCTTKPPKQRKEPEYQPVSSAKHTGTVTFYNAERKYGFIEGGLFFHSSAVIDGNAGFIRKGTVVAYEEGVDRKSGGIKAVDIQLVNKQTGGNKND